MPKETFYRLPDEKRERIMAAAEREFLENSFEAASINRIIKEAVFISILRIKKIYFYILLIRIKMKHLILLKIS